MAAFIIISFIAIICFLAYLDTNKSDEYKAGHRKGYSDGYEDSFFGNDREDSFRSKDSFWGSTSDYDKGYSDGYNDGYDDENE